MTDSIGGGGGRGVRLVHDGGDSVAGGNTEVPLALNTSEYDTLNAGDLSNDRVVIPKDGLYLLIGQTVLLEVPDGTEIDAKVMKNGNTYVGGTTMTGGSDPSFGAKAVDVRELEQGDVMTLAAEQSSGGSLETAGGNLTVLEV